MEMTRKLRDETDLLGAFLVPVEACSGIQPQPVVEASRVAHTSINPSRSFVKDLASARHGAAPANQGQGLLETQLADAIQLACREFINSALYDQLVLDMVQSDANTSDNKKTDEVIANHVLELLSHQRGYYQHIGPNINMSQATKYVFPTVARLGLNLSLELLIRCLELLTNNLKNAEKFVSVMMTARANLQNAAQISPKNKFTSFAAILLNSEQLQKIFSSPVLVTSDLDST